jgi:hypothetical protein
MTELLVTRSFYGLKEYERFCEWELARVGDRALSMGFPGIVSGMGVGWWRVEEP